MSMLASTCFHLFPSPSHKDLVVSVSEQEHSPKCAQPGILHALCAEEGPLELVEYSRRFGCLKRIVPVLLRSLSFVSLFCYKEALRISQLGPLPARESLLELKPTLKRCP